MIKILTDSAICMCPHGGQLQFIVTHLKADGADGQVLTLQEYSNAMIVGCALPPVAGGPCMKVMIAQDPIGQAMKVQGNTVVTQMVISFTDKGWPIMVVSPGMSALSIMLEPSSFLARKAEFAQASLTKHGVTADAASAAGSWSTTPFKDVIAAFWGSDYARREQDVKLMGTTVGFGDGTPATLLVYKYDVDGSHEFKKRLISSVKGNRVETDWLFEYQDDVDDLLNLYEGDEYYLPPDYYFELKVGGKTARSNLLEFIDWTEVELVDDDGNPVRHADYTAYLADDSTRIGSLDGDGKAKLIDIPAGKVHWSFKPQLKAVVSAEWSSEYARRDETVTLLGRTSGFGDGTPGTLHIFEHDADGNHDLTAELTATVEGDRVVAEWPFEYQKDVDDLPDKVEGDEVYHAPEYFFELVVASKSARSGLIEFKDWIEVELLDEDDNPLADTDFIAHFADGSSQQGKTDGSGKARLVDIPPGRVHLEFPGSTGSQDAEASPAGAEETQPNPAGAEAPQPSPAKTEQSEEDGEAEEDDNDCEEEVVFPSGEKLCVVKDQPVATENDEHWDAFADRFGLASGPLLDCRGKGSVKLADNFTVKEFTKGAAYARIDPKLVEKLQQLRNLVGPIRITSGYRSWAYNKKLYEERYNKKPTKSPHTHGIAADIRVGNMKAVDLAKKAIDVFGCTMGIGLVMNNETLHVDSRSKWAIWPYGSKKNRDKQYLASIEARDEVVSYRRSKC